MGFGDGGERSLCWTKKDKLIGGWDGNWGRNTIALFMYNIKPKEKTFSCTTN